VAAYGAALERQDWPSAYALLSSSYRKRVPYPAFEARMRAAAADHQAAGRALRARATRPGVRIEVPLDREEKAMLVREDGAFRLDAPPADPFGQSTPRQALATFVRALERGRWDDLLALAPARHRAELTAEALRRHWDQQGPERRQALTRALRLALDAPIRQEGAEAFLLYANGRQVTFVREDDLWRIESPE
jgi:hypothetical protein